MNLPRSIFLLPEELARRVYDAGAVAEIFRVTRCAGFVAPAAAATHGGLADIEVAFTGWGCGALDAGVLEALPALRAIFYAGGSVKYWADDAVWERGITVASASAANAIPVAEYTVGAILFSLKCGWHYVGRHQRERRYPWPPVDAPGGADVTIGIQSLGLIGRLVCERLRPFGFKVLACDRPATRPRSAWNWFRFRSFSRAAPS
jgi:phosphoglycerate dehydrogenase-like enzyme